jgi:hypothetical protein
MDLLKISINPKKIPVTAGTRFFNGDIDRAELLDGLSLLVASKI